MGVLENQLVEQMIKASTKSKEEIGNMIVLALGGDPTKQAKKLPKRRGNADGGIDGRVPIQWEVDSMIMRRNSREILKTTIVQQDTEAAICVKIENSSFTRDEFGAFINDMDREGIFNGIIVTARGISPDVKYEMGRRNAEKKYLLNQITLSEILEGNLDLEFDFKQPPSQALRNFLNKNLEK